MSLTTKVKLGLLATGIAAGVALPYLTSPFIIGIVTLALVFGLFAMSIDVLAGFGGLVTVGQAGIFAVAAYGVGYTATHLDGGHVLQVAVGLAAGIAISVIFAIMAMRTSGVYFLMVTLAQGMIVWGLAYRLAPITGAENGLRGILRPPAVSAYWTYYYLVLAIVALAGGLLWIVTRSPVGLALRGLRDGEDRLRMLGYNTAFHKAYVFVLSGLFATIAGILYVYLNQFISPAASEFATSGHGLLMAILGGTGTLVGPLIGAFVIVFAENMLSTYVERWTTLLGAVFVITILFARGGLVGMLSQAWPRVLARFGHPAASGDAGAGSPPGAALDGTAHATSNPHGITTEDDQRSSR
ncbi:branched-chain amino acid ABC transporter permease [Actinobacteria bacterium YIM 96077]|uniref:Branched-chain amino acid ABC transporter permease n=1 Tax=Phytoactinopolyspora halophila TaxID=1981511 RepID=A0A329QN61_9ACTN|nr:branched-chain amino acid ABC transporter permease [Phytoactinopolyspora halophila]AYY12288.1 branched-chain amino acid ABC transporter permease [Actinobacteria bacterium YIM 96077]RAW13794.1 branched-chain amino acid ABC transporter permease [Phytoactinopolyspora halophila]